MATAKVTPVTPITTQPIQNILAFRTKLGAEPISAGETKDLGMVDVSHFEKIRIVADERTGSGCNVIVRLTITEGNELVAFLDEFTLMPHQQTTKVYDVPCAKLMVSLSRRPDLWPVLKANTNFSLLFMGEE
jgi:type III secretion protein HrpB1